MHVDLIYRCYFEKSKGNMIYFDRLTDWINEIRVLDGNIFEVKDKQFEWKLVNANTLNDIINDDFTDWIFIRALDNSFEAICKRLEPQKDNSGVEKSLTFNTLWLLKSNITKLEINEYPIHIWSPHISETPIHRVNFDFITLIKKLQDLKIKITKFVEYKEFKSHSIRIR
jgi:hypothetical protein